MNKSELEEIYRSYGFEVDNSIHNIPVFLYKKGRYYGADIIPLNHDEDIKLQAEELKNKYSDIGYATTLKIFNCIAEAKIELFKSFFSYDATLERLRKKYSDFSKKQTQNLLGSEYQYIKSPFEIYDEKKEDEDFIQLIQNIIINDTNPHLIIIEAAAGYGKTSTAFELLNCLISNYEANKIPIITELARNRGAKIFRYILLDEIDNEFQTLHSDLVIKEIKEGRIPIIIDGFDELLTKISLESDISNLEEVEPMLNTISNLLEKNAKIILTTRKTAIFNGSEFERWKAKWDNNFSVTRISIKEPRINDWIGVEKCRILEEKNLQINAIANPVILSYLRNLSLQDFKTQISKNENLVDQYFQKMLEREKERHNLLMTVENQFEIFKNVTKLLIEFDASSESKDFFKEIIKDQNFKLLETVRTHYPEKPSIDNLVDTLATHALLDRKGKEGNQIGFINDFIFGCFIGDIITDSKIEDIKDKFSTYMIELSVTAFKVQNSEKRNLLWEKLIQLKDKFTPYIIFNFDLILKNSLFRNYTDLDIKEWSFYNINFINFQITNTVFVNCNFKNCQFDVNIFQGVSFINCVFDKCTTLFGYIDEYYEGASTINCTEKNCHVLIDSDRYDEISDFTQLDDLQITILNIMWAFSDMKKHFISSLIRKVEGISIKKITSAISDLEHKRYITIRGNNIEFNLNRMSDIKNILNK